MKKYYVITERKVSLSVEESSAVRHLICCRYEACLNIAVRKKWKSFTCEKCPIFKEYIALLHHNDETLEHSLEEL